MVTGSAFFAHSFFVTNIGLGAESDPRIYRSAYFLGRGDTGVAAADNEEAIFYNPAGIAQGKGVYKRTVFLSPQLEISQDTKTLVKQMVKPDGNTIATLREHIGKPQHAAIYDFTGIVLRRAALGAFVSGTTDILVSKDPGRESGGLEKVSAGLSNTVGLAFSLADVFLHEKLLLGVTGKYMQRGEAAIDVGIIDAKNMQNQSASDLFGYGTGMGADAGMMYRLGGQANFTVGATMHNVGNTYFTSLDENTNPPVELLQTVDVGIALEPGTKFSKFRLLADYTDVTSQYTANAFKKVHLGGELTVKDFIGFTGGLNQGGACGGFYLDFYIMRIDLGMYTEETSDRVGVRPDRRYFARFKMGL